MFSIAKNIFFTLAFSLILFLFLSCSSLDLTLEIFNKCRHRQRILPLATQREFVLLYNGCSPPGSALACSTSNTNRECNQKITRESQKTQIRRTKSGKVVSSASLDDSVIVSTSGKGRTGHCPTSSTTTSPLHQSSMQGPSDVCSTVQTVRNKNIRTRQEFKISKCTLHHRLRAADDVKHSNAQTKKVIMSLSSPALTVRIPISASQETTTTFPPHAGPPAEDPERGEETGEEVKTQTA